MYMEMLRGNGFILHSSPNHLKDWPWSTMPLPCALDCHDELLMALMGRIVCSWCYSTTVVITDNDAFSTIHNILCCSTFSWDLMEQNALKLLINCWEQYIVAVAGSTPQPYDDDPSFPSFLGKMLVDTSRLYYMFDEQLYAVILNGWLDRLPYTQYHHRMV